MSTVEPAWLVWLVRIALMIGFLSAGLALGITIANVGGVCQ